LAGMPRRTGATGSSARRIVARLGFVARDMALVLPTVLVLRDAQRVRRPRGKEGLTTVRHEIEVLPDPETVARRAAEYVAERARAAVAGHGRFTFAISGGHTPWAMFDRLTEKDMPWEQVILYQVDERVAPAGDPDRNLTHLRDSLGEVPAEVIAMPVDDPDQADAADRYGALLPERFDLVHLGLGPDGHTASLVPGDPVLDVTDHLVATTGAYQGRQRMTLTYPALARADQILWLITGEDKKTPLAKLLAGDRSIPAGRVQAARSLVLADAAAA
jgi:6-phosphogluconolactonase